MEPYDEKRKRACRQELPRSSLGLQRAAAKSASSFFFTAVQIAVMSLQATAAKARLKSQETTRASPAEHDHWARGLAAVLS